MDNKNQTLEQELMFNEFMHGFGDKLNALMGAWDLIAISKEAKYQLLVEDKIKGMPKSYSELRGIVQQTYLENEQHSQHFLILRNLVEMVAGMVEVTGNYLVTPNLNHLKLSEDNTPLLVNGVQALNWLNYLADKYDQMVNTNKARRRCAEKHPEILIEGWKPPKYKG